MLYEKNGYNKRSIASLTKMMTAIVTVENVKLDEVVEVKTGSNSIGGSTIGIKRGDNITVKALLYGMLMESGNDCAYALAEYVGENVENFAKLMNEKAKEIGAKDSNFVTPHGLDMPDQYSTAYDIAMVTRYALNNKYINEIVGTNEINILFGDVTKTFNNTNKLLRTYPNSDGVKTGFTNGANRCLIASAKKGDFRPIVVILGAETTETRFGDAEKLLDYALENYEIKDISKNMNWYINIPVVKGTIDYYEKYMMGEMLVAMTAEEYEKIYVKQQLLPVINAPLNKGYNLGNISIFVGNEEIYREKIMLDINIYKKNIGDYMLESIKNIFELNIDLI